MHCYNGKGLDFSVPVMKSRNVMMSYETVCFQRGCDGQVCTVQTFDHNETSSPEEPTISATSFIFVYQMVNGN